MADNKRLDILDIIKGLMIVFIIITHYSWNYPEDYLKYGFVYYIDMAVPVFMIISGFLYAKGYERTQLSNLKDAYTIDSIVPKLLRFAIPWLVAVIIEIPFLIYQRTSCVEMIRIFIRGGRTR